MVVMIGVESVPTMAEKALSTHRSSQRVSPGTSTTTGGNVNPLIATPIRARNFTLDRKKSREIADLQIAEAMAEWLTSETGRQVRGMDLAEDLESGVVFCILATKFGQIVRFKDPPKNEFERMQNFDLFKTALSRMDLSCAPPPSKRGAELKDVLPCLIELAALATKHGIAMGEKVQAPTMLMGETRQDSVTPPPSLPVKMDSEGTGFLADDEADEDAGEDEEDITSLLGSLHELRMARQRAKPPKLKFMKVGGKELMIVERPGEAVGSIVWEGAAILVRYLHEKEEYRFRDPQSRVLELGSGVGVCGIWAACEGSDVVVTDIPASVDLLWANVAANAQTIVQSGGSCSARALDFNDVAATSRLVAQMGAEGPLTVLASDVVYNETIGPLITTVAAIFTVRPDATLYLSYKPRDAAAESVFFDTLEQKHDIVLTKVGGEDKTQVFCGRLKAEKVAV